jgi:hypothetical protein
MSNEHTPLWSDSEIRERTRKKLPETGNALHISDGAWDKMTHDALLQVAKEMRQDYQAELAALRARIVELEVQLHESERSWTVSTAKYRKYKAKELLVHYFKLVMNRSGVGWDWDNELEINDIVDLIVEAAVLEATTPKEQPHE